MKKAQQAKTPVTETKTYILELAPNGYGPAIQRKKVTVPASWKITYGPAAQGAHLGGQNPFVLRFYEGQKEHMRALFHNVLAFRDVTIKVEEEVERVQAETLLRNTPSGSKNVVVEGRMREWRDADSPDRGFQQDQAFLQLPAPGVQFQPAPYQPAQPMVVPPPGPPPGGYPSPQGY